MLHLRRAGYRSMPWRNGGGVTLEIAREPGAGDVFTWRLSLATVAARGPFSDFTGYQRSVTLIEGDGFKLGIGGQDPMVLDWPGATALFPGNAPARCDLVTGPSTDLSLMVREPGAIISVVRIQGITTLTVPLAAGALKAVFCLRDGPRLTLPDDPIAGNPMRPELKLALHDTALLGREVTSLSLAAPMGITTDLLLLTWKVASSERA
jgi:environmental stress-induced protein Ves